MIRLSSVIFVFCVVCWLHLVCGNWQSVSEGVTLIKFLVTVNDTWGDCIDTVSTPALFSGKTFNETTPISVGNCDKGPLIFNVLPDIKNVMWVNVTFFSSVIEDAPHPACMIPWNGNYIDPITQDPTESPLPTCWVAMSREGYHMTYYWFRLLEWEFL